MSKFIKVLINSEKTILDADISGVTGVNGIKVGNPNESIDTVINVLDTIKGGADSSSVTINGGAVKASALVGFGGATGIAPTETVTINGVAFEAVDSGASGLYQFNIGVTGPSNLDSATNLVTKINAATSAKIDGIVTAAVSGVTGLAWVTLTSDEPGIHGNGFTVTTTATGATGVSNFSSGGNGPTSATVTK